MDSIEHLLQTGADFVWVPPLLILLLGTHVFLTVKLRFIQRYIFKGIRLSFSVQPNAIASIVHETFNVPRWITGLTMTTLTTVWSFADITNGLMATPNLISLLGLSGVIVSETRKYLWSGNLDQWAPDDSRS